MNDVILYHGSRGGLDGDIRAESRQRCDFGCGFYMGTNKDQAAGLVIEDPSPVLYKLKFRLSEIDEAKVLRLSGEDWLYTVLANRDRVHSISRSAIGQEARARTEGYDVIIGPIADDRMNEAIKQFEQNRITDSVLIACLSSIDYGEQYVVKSQDVCKKIEILDERDLYGKEADIIRDYTQGMRKNSYDVVDRMARLHRREGKYLDEIVSEKLKGRDKHGR